MEIGGDMTSLDPELLQLSEVSPSALKTSPQLAEELFTQWLSLPATDRLVFCLQNQSFLFIIIEFCQTYMCIGPLSFSGLLLDFDVYGLNCFLWFMMQFRFKTCWEGQSNYKGPFYNKFGIR